MSEAGKSNGQMHRLAEAARREKARRREANMKAREARQSQGLRRVEKWVPAAHVAEIRPLVTRLIGEIAAGRQPVLVIHDRIGTATPAQAASPDPGEADCTTPPAPGTKGLTLVERRRAQAARLRAKRQSEGAMRTTFEVPAIHAAKVLSLVERIIELIAQGLTATLAEPVAPIGEAGPMPDPAALASLPAPVILTSAERSPLFDDIKAACAILGRKD